MSSIQEKAQQDQAKEISLKLETAVEGLVPGSPERKVALKKTIDDIVSTVVKDEAVKSFWDFSAEKARPVFIRNDDIVLRPVALSDADFYVDIKARYSMMYRGILSVAKDKNEGLFYVDLCKPESFFCIAEDTVSGSPVGYLGIKDTGTDTWEIAIELDRQYTHRGFGSKSLQLFLNELHRIAGKAEFKALVEVDNVPSQKCFEKLGAELIGLCNGPILKLESEKERFEDNNLNLIDDNMRRLAKRLNVKPRKLLSHVLDYRLTCPL